MGSVVESWEMTEGTNFPSKFAITNRWAICELPAKVMKHATEVTGPLFATVQPYSFVMSYMGGAHHCK